LVKGDSIFAKIVSVNVYGESQQSLAGNGALIQTIPDSPINLLNDASTTTGYLIKFTWTEGISNGGSKVIDYNIYYDQGLGVYVLLAQKVTSTFYETSTTLTPGVTYSFKLTSRNSVGSSDHSAVL
jgi:hypothetical protein